MRFGSVCSGIESASVAWEPLGWEAAWFAEVEPFPSAVLAHHWPRVVNYGDMCRLPEFIAAGAIEAPDVLVGGTPCQAFSVAGMRGGLEDERGQLTIKYVEVANAIDEKRPAGEECIAVWENVPGVLSSKDNAFGCFLAALVGEDEPLQPTGKKWGNAGIVYGPQRVAAWRVLDAQYFGVARRRRRVFVVASARDGFCPASVLFESEGLRRDTSPSREAGEETTSDAAVCTGNGYWKNAKGVASSVRAQDNPKDSTVIITPEGKKWPAEVAATLNASFGEKQGLEDQHALGGASLFVPLALMGNQRAEIRLSEQTDSLTQGGGKPGQGYAAAFSPVSMQVRRLTPRECERLQGFPDDHVCIPWRKKAAEDCPDGPRYKAIGNSKAVPVVRWLGERIAGVL